MTRKEEKTKGEARAKHARKVRKDEEEGEESTRELMDTQQEEEAHQDPPAEER